MEYWFNEFNLYVSLHYHSPKGTGHTGAGIK